MVKERRKLVVVLYSCVLMSLWVGAGVEVFELEKFKLWLNSVV